MAEPVGGNQAIAAATTFTVAPNGSYPGGVTYYLDDTISAYVTTGSVLGNGQVYEVAQFSTSYVAWTTADPIFSLDLGEARSGTWWIQGQYGTDSIVRPTAVTLDYSDNGSSWTTLDARTGLTAGGQPGGRGWLMSFDASAQSHRYWRWTLAYDSTFLFVADVRLV
jgi:hypothetical protein